MTEPLPEFPYHPDPLATGSVVAADAACACCGKDRGYLYVGPVYAVEEPAGRICPWCIADGNAAARYEAHFSGGAAGDDAPMEVLRAIAECTPGFTGWQDEQWLLHCGDGAAFLGRAGARELEARPDAVEFLRSEVSDLGWQPEQYLADLDKDGQPTAYLFQCRVCAVHLAYSDVV
ncbi:CbrC family protein [Streptomyces sp. NPDC057011]|uniref:CbrC family protein n=1 Tax=unclassified Streptomyces TaxID=2593676 RepID=UPI00362F9EFF